MYVLNLVWGSPAMTVCCCWARRFWAWVGGAPTGPPALELAAMRPCAFMVSAMRWMVMATGEKEKEKRGSGDGERI
jgi:hypothetical protein